MSDLKILNKPVRVRSNVFFRIRKLVVYHYEFYNAFYYFTLV